MISELSLFPKGNIEEFVLDGICHCTKPELHLMYKVNNDDDLVKVKTYPCKRCGGQKL